MHRIVLATTLAIFAVSPALAHQQVAGKHSHVHGAKCGHAPAKHAGHTDYVHDGHLHHQHGAHADEHGAAPAK